MKKQQEEEQNLDPEIPEFLISDPEEIDAYKKLHMLGQILDKNGDGLS